jgi:hypothetical protein
VAAPSSAVAWSSLSTAVPPGGYGQGEGPSPTPAAARTPAPGRGGSA